MTTPRKNPREFIPEDYQALADNIAYFANQSQDPALHRRIAEAVSNDYRDKLVLQFFHKMLGELDEEKQQKLFSNVKNYLENKAKNKDIPDGLKGIEELHFAKNESETKKTPSPNKEQKQPLDLKQPAPDEQDIDEEQKQAALQFAGKIQKIAEDYRAKFGTKKTWRHSHQDIARQLIEQAGKVKDGKDYKKDLAALIHSVSALNDHQLKKKGQLYREINQQEANLRMLRHKESPRDKINYLLATVIKICDAYDDQIVKDKKGLLSRLKKHKHGAKVAELRREAQKCQQEINDISNQEPQVIDFLVNSKAQAFIETLELSRATLGQRGSLYNALTYGTGPLVSELDETPLALMKEMHPDHTFGEQESCARNMISMGRRNSNS